MASTEKNSENPVLIDGKRFESDCLPPMESTDLLCYLVLETSYYMQKNKAFRSLEVYNQIWFINCSHCLGCKAGLAESCLLIANALFYFEAWTKVNGRISCSQIKSL